MECSVLFYCGHEENMHEACGRVKGFVTGCDMPLTRSTVRITCHLPDESKISISRSQIEILPNFAMTDFASQGKTRPYNPVDLIIVDPIKHIIQHFHEVLLLMELL